MTAKIVRLLNGEDVIADVKEAYPDEKSYQPIGYVLTNPYQVTLNATAEMIPVTWEEMNLHPFVPSDQAQGYSQMISTLNNWLCEITGFSSISLILLAYSL